MTLESLNELSTDEARRVFLECCASAAFANAMVAKRPFFNQEQLMATASSVWESLNVVDWLEAFAAHPRIGERKVDQGSKFGQWSAEEQKKVKKASQSTLTTLQTLNERYFEKHGFVFLICATGKSGDELLFELQRRLESSHDEELKTAAIEQDKITRLRLARLL